MIIKENNSPSFSQAIDVLLIWFNESPLKKGRKIIIKHTTSENKALVDEILYEININSLHKIQNANSLKVNSIGRVKLWSSKNIFFDTYYKNRSTGSIILIDPNTNQTLGAALIIG